MSVRIWATAATIACAALFAVMPWPSTSVEIPNDTAVVAIDFDALRAEAAAALRALEESREHRLASAPVTAF
ncbi:MAG TPA: hypothetical protein VFL49_01700 [Pseudolabrys sp.]|jgi:hypothetical protein|nr:hypothetical protein [Pseudolabrys sp.]